MVDGSQDEASAKVAERYNASRTFLQHLRVRDHSDDTDAPAGSHKQPRQEPPHITLTFAQTIDGCIAGKNGKQLTLSGAESMAMTHW